MLPTREDLLKWKDPGLTREILPLLLCLDQRLRDFPLYDKNLLQTIFHLMQLNGSSLFECWKNHPSLFSLLMTDITPVEIEKEIASILSVVTTAPYARAEKKKILYSFDTEEISSRERIGIDTYGQL